MVLVLISDTHQLQNELDVPRGDILIHCGDWTMLSQSLAEIENVNAWLGGLPHRHKILVPGNHDSYLEADPGRRKLTYNATVLINEAITIEGLNFYGSPLTPLCGTAFGRSSPADRRRQWGRVPTETHVLICHGPPFGILDRPPGQDEHMGDPELLERCRELPNLRLVCFGHIHGAYGMEERDDVLYVNAALMGSEGDLEHRPIALYLEPKD